MKDSTGGNGPEREDDGRPYLDSFLARSVWHSSVIGGIFMDTEDALEDISRKLKKLFHFVGGVTAEEVDDSDPTEEQLDQKRQWQGKKLQHINRAMYHLIGDILKAKLQILDAMERLKMANLERSLQKDLQMSKPKSEGPLATDPKDWIEDDD